MKLITTIFLTLFPLITFANSSLPANRHISSAGHGGGISRARHG